MSEKMLPITISAPVSHGRRLGHKLGAPTINQRLTSAEQEIPYGVYFSRCTVDGRTYDAVTNLGVKPTVGTENVPVAETHLLDCETELYGHDARTELLFFCRAEKRFPSKEALAAAISRDIGAAREYFRNKSEEK